MALMCQILVATTAGGAWASAVPESDVQPNRDSFTQPAADVEARVGGSQAGDNAELDLRSDAFHARLFSNARVIGDFSGSRVRFGATARSPYLAGLGIGDGVSTRVRVGRYSVTGAFLSTRQARTMATEVTAFDGNLAVQAGHRDSGRAVGSTSFAGAHVDFDALNAKFSVRWHMGREQVEGGSRDSSAGGVAVRLSSVLEDGDRLRAAMFRPVTQGFDLDVPDLTLAYSMPVSIGRLICSGGVDAQATRVSAVRVSWGVTW